MRRVLFTVCVVFRSRCSCINGTFSSANAGNAFHCLHYGTQRMDGTFSLANAGRAVHCLRCFPFPLLMHKLHLFISQCGECFLLSALRHANAWMAPFHQPMRGLLFTVCCFCSRLSGSSSYFQLHIVLLFRRRL